MTVQEDRAVGVIAVHKQPNGEFLFCLVQHADGHWGFPKGHKESGESDEQAARRELREETGVTEVEIVPDKLFSEQYSFDAGGVRHNKTVSYFIGFVQEPSTATLESFRDEILEVRWLPYKEMRRTLTFSKGKGNMLDEVWQLVRQRLK